MIAGNFLHGFRLLCRLLFLCRLFRLLHFLDLLRLDHLPELALIKEIIADLLSVLDGIKKHLGRVSDCLCPALNIRLVQIQIALHLLIGQRNTELLGGHRRRDFRTQLLDGVFLPCDTKAPPQPAGCSRGMTGFMQEAAHIAVSIPEVALRRHHDFVLGGRVMTVGAVTVKPDRHILDKGIPILADQPDVHHWRLLFQRRNSLDLLGIKHIAVAAVKVEVALLGFSVTKLPRSFLKIHDLVCVNIDGAPKLHRHTLGALPDTPALFLGLAKGAPAGVIKAKFF